MTLQVLSLTEFHQFKILLFHLSLDFLPLLIGILTIVKPHQFTESEMENLERLMSILNSVNLSPSSLDVRAWSFSPSVYFGQFFFLALSNQSVLVLS